MPTRLIVKILKIVTPPFNMLGTRRLERKILMKVQREGWITIPARRIMLMDMERRNRRFRSSDKPSKILVRFNKV